MTRFAFSTVPAMLVLVVLCSSVMAGGAKSVGPFPVREPEEGTALYVVYEVLKAGVETDLKTARKSYERLCMRNRKSDKAADKALQDKEWENLRAQAGAYLIHDLHGFKLWVEEMTPGPAFVKKSTRKAYVTVRNKLEGEERRGLLIIERNKKGRWKLRSLNL
jgi:hypothetical protein